MDKLNLDQHISQQYNAALDDLKTEFLEMGGIVEQQVINAVQAITDVDIALAQKVLVVEKEVDDREVSLDELCTRIIARRQPTASDLRLVLSISKATRDLERMGDEAKKIAQMAIALSDSDDLPHGFSELRNLGRNVQQMVNDTLTAFARYDVHTALQVARDDKAVDREYDTAMRELITYMMEDPRNISRAMNIIWALRALERIGDHAGNIAEHIIYLVKGRDVRHKTTLEIQDEIHNN
ncbi:MAG: phosphate signaling complex protein PhoU [Cellvibrionaceae bacterium]|nr:phosphate signaling complex protein PhoU [Cellvibrionaceae bacterium]